MSLKLSHEEWINNISHNKNIDIVGRYVDSTTKILCHCKLCNEYYYAIPSAISSMKIHKMCANKLRVKKVTSKIEDIIKEIYDSNNSIEIIDTSEYITKEHGYIKCRCKICGYECKASARNLIKGTGCAKCSKKYQATTEEFKEEISKINNNIVILGDYVGNKNKIDCECIICGNKWSAYPLDLRRGHGCGKCARVQKKTHEEFVNQLSQKRNDIEVISTYSGGKSNILCKCKICGTEFEVIAGNLLLGHGKCPKCDLKSRGENKIIQYFDENNIPYITQKRFKDCKDKKALPFDFYVPSENLLIEFNGMQHYQPIKYFGGNKKYNIQKLHDNIKIRYAENNGYELLTISYTDFLNIYNILNSYFRKVS